MILSIKYTNLTSRKNVHKLHIHVPQKFSPKVPPPGRLSDELIKMSGVCVQFIDKPGFIE